jgi:hypothetical protein
MRKALTFLLIAILTAINLPVARAADTLVYSNASACGGWGPGTTIWTFQMNTTVGGTISALEVPLQSNTGASTITLRIFNEISGGPGNLLGTFNYDAATSTSSLARFLGSATVSTGNFYWQYYSTSSSDPCSNGSYSNTVNGTWSAIAYRFKSSSTSGPFTWDSGGGGASAIQLKIYTTVPDTTPPSFTSGTTYSIPENSTLVGTSGTNESSTISLFGGSDQNKFSISRTDSQTASISFLTAPNFEAPSDSNLDNVYQAVIRAVDTSGNAGYETITATVTDVDENARVLSYAITGTPTKGSQSTINTVLNFSSRVTFFSNGKRIAGCINKPSVGSGPITASCTWKPTTRGAIALTFRVVPTAANNFATSSAPSLVTVGSRVNTR